MLLIICGKLSNMLWKGTVCSECKTCSHAWKCRGKNYLSVFLWKTRLELMWRLAPLWINEKSLFWFYFFIVFVVGEGEPIPFSAQNIPSSCEWKKLNLQRRNEHVNEITWPSWTVFSSRMINKSTGSYIYSLYHILPWKHFNWEEREVFYMQYIQSSKASP